MLGGKPVPVMIWLPKIPHGMPWEQTWVSVQRGWWITTWYDPQKYVFQKFYTVMRGTFYVMYQLFVWSSSHTTKVILILPSTPLHYFPNILITFPTRHNWNTMMCPTYVLFGCLQGHQCSKSGWWFQLTL